MPWWIWLIIIYFSFNLFIAIWLSRTSRGKTTYINNIIGFMLMFLFGGIAGIIGLIGKGIN